MTDPQPAPGKQRPRRADPLQPDKPGSGTGSSPHPQAPGHDGAVKPTAKRQKEQSDTALENVREGYD